MEQLTVNDFLGSVDENYRSQLLKNRKKWIPDKLVSYGNLDNWLYTIPISAVF